MPQTRELQVPARRRRYAQAFKAEIVAQCQAGDVSVAGVTRQNGINANLVHRWIRELNSPRQRQNIVPTAPAFVLVPLSIPATAVRPSAIEISIQRPGGAVVLGCPSRQVSECAALLREWLG